MPIDKDLWGLFVQFEENKERATARAKEICVDFLGSSWADAQFNVEKMSGGQTNLVYKCSIPGQSVLLRVQSDKDVMQLQNELIILMKLAENKIGPKLLGVFPGGRLEEFIPSRALANEECRKPGFARHIARALAKIHQISVPLSKSPQLIPVLRQWVDRIEKNGGAEFELWSRCAEITADKFPAKVNLSDLRKEIDQIENYLEKTSSPARLTHNDLYGPNILLREGYKLEEDGTVTRSVDGENDPLVIIDFEFSMYNYRGFDIANYLNDMALKFSITEFSYEFDVFLAKNSLQEAFCTAYLKETYAQLREKNVPVEEEGLIGDLSRDLELMQKEVATFRAISNIRWGIWEIICHQEGIVGSDFYNSLRNRLSLYYYLKNF